MCENLWITSVNPLLPKLGPKLTHPCLFERRRHSMANCGRIVRDQQAVWCHYEPTDVAFCRICFGPHGELYSRNYFTTFSHITSVFSQLNRVPNFRNSHGVDCDRCSIETGDYWTSVLINLTNLTDNFTGVSRNWVNCRTTVYLQYDEMISK